MFLANGRDGGLRHAEPPGATRLRAPHVDRVELPRHGHRREHAHPHVERAFEADEGAQMREAASQLRAVEEHRERPLQRATALDDAVHDRVVLGSDLVLAGDGR